MESSAQEQLPAPWYKHRWPWILMSGPFVVVLAGLFTFYLASTHADDMVSDDYYKEGKYINMQIERDDFATAHHIQAQVMFDDTQTVAKVFVSGEFDRQQPLKLRLLHPAKKAFDQTVQLKMIASSGDKTEYMAQLQRLPAAVHWYVRLEDAMSKWRIETKWLPKQGNMVSLSPKFDENAVASLAR